MIFEWFESAATITTAAFVNGIWIGALLAAAAWGGIRLLSIRHPLNATTRFYVWMTVFMMSAGLVLWQGERCLDDRELQVEEMYAPVPPSAVSPVEPAPAPPPAPVKSLEAETPVAPAHPVTPLMEAPPSPSTPAAIEDAPGLVEAAIAPAVAKLSLPDQIEFTGLDPFWRIVLFTIWMTIASMLLLRILFGLRSVWRLKKNSYPAPERVQTSLQKLLKQMDGPRAIRVAISDEVQTAVAIGFLKPEILLPASMLAALTSKELEQVLLHEAAHLQRRDDWTMLFQRVVSALLFFHPGIMLMGKLMDRDREFACDDWVIALTRRPKAYASCLAKLVTQHARTQAPMIVPGFSSSKEALFERVKTILDKKRTISFKLSRLTFAGVLLITVLLLVLMIKVVPVIALPNHETAFVFLEISEPASEVTTWTAPSPVITEEADRTGEKADNGASSIEAVADFINEGQPGEPENRPSLSTGVTSFSELSLGYNGDSAATLLPLPVAEVPVAEPVVQRVTARADTSSLSAKSMSRILLAARHIPSSTDRAQILIKAAGNMEFKTKAIFEAYLQTADSVPSSGDKARALMALSENQQMDEASAVLFLNSVSGILSASDKSRVLINSLNRDALPLKAEPVRDAYLTAIDHISSSTEYRRVMKAFLTKIR